MKKFQLHYETCQEVPDCIEPHCKDWRMILDHSVMCIEEFCPLCWKDWDVNGKTESSENDSFLIKVPCEPVKLKPKVVFFALKSQFEEILLDDYEITFPKNRVKLILQKQLTFIYHAMVCFGKNRDQKTANCNEYKVRILLFFPCQKKRKMFRMINCFFFCFSALHHTVKHLEIHLNIYKHVNVEKTAKLVTVDLQELYLHIGFLATFPIVFSVPY